MKFKPQFSHTIPKFGTLVQTQILPDSLYPSNKETMAMKRKHDSESTEPTEPPQKQQQTEEDEQQEVLKQQINEQENAEEFEEEGGGVKIENNQLQIDSVAANSERNLDDDEDDEPVQMLLEPFGKDQLIGLLLEAASKHSDVADSIRSIANEDPAQRKIFIHGLGWDTNSDTLIETFKQYGEIEDCKAVCDKISGKSKGYGFILFKNRSGARRALKERQKKIGSRVTACQLATVGPVTSPSAQPTAVPVQPVSEYTQRKIYVSNVGEDLDPQKLYAFFSKFGEIEDGPLGLDKVTKKPKGFSLFVYKSVESAKRALEEPHKNFEGHMLHCQKAVDGPKQVKSQHQHRHQYQHQNHHNPRNSHFQRNDHGGYVGAANRSGHLMAPAGAGMGASSSQQALNPALGQALSALFATQGGGLGLNPALGLLGSLGSAGVVHQGVPPAGAGLQGVYGNQTSISPGVLSVYGSQGAYPNQQIGQGGSGRVQHGAGQYGGVGPYMGH